MIDLNAALAELEQDGRVRLYHAPSADFWTCGVFPADHGSRAAYSHVARTPEEAIRLCLAEKANKAARERLGALLTPLAPRGWGR